MCKQPVLPCFFGKNWLRKVRWLPGERLRGSRQRYLAARVQLWVLGSGGGSMWSFSKQVSLHRGTLRHGEKFQTVWIFLVLDLSGGLHCFCI